MDPIEAGTKAVGKPPPPDAVAWRETTNDARRDPPQWLNWDSYLTLCRSPDMATRVHYFDTVKSREIERDEETRRWATRSD